MSGKPVERETSATWRDVPRSVWTLGFVSMFMDVSSEMIHAALPLYLVSAFGASALVVGAIEGVAEATAAAETRARTADDADTPLDPDRAQRLHDHDRQLCRLAPAVAGCPASADPGRGRDAAL